MQKAGSINHTFSPLTFHRAFQNIYFYDIDIIKIISPFV